MQLYTYDIIEYRTIKFSLILLNPLYLPDFMNQTKSILIANPAIYIKTKYDKYISNLLQ